MGKVTGFLEIDRQVPRYQPASDRIRHFREFTLPMNEREVEKQAAGGRARLRCGVSPRPFAVWAGTSEQTRTDDGPAFDSVSHDAVVLALPQRAQPCALAPARAAHARRDLMHRLGHEPLHSTGTCLRDHPRRGGPIANM